MIVQENTLHFNVLQLNALCLALKRQNSKQNNSDGIRQRDCIRLSKQTRGGHVPPSLVHLGLLQSLKYTQKRQTYSGLLKCYS